MKALSNYITEAIKIGKSAKNISVYTCQPRNKEELKNIIRDRISKEGYECDLNDIDTSLVDDMSNLFYDSSFNGDISKWNTSNVRNMSWMFYFADFNGDLSRWNVSNVKNMSAMFAWSNFNKDISNWKINEDCDTLRMLYGCPIKEEFKPKLLQKK